MARLMTPLLRQLRSDSGTLYVFPSATEDIGLNLNSRGNRVALSKYVLLNLPITNTSVSGMNNGETSLKNYFNFTNIPDIANMLNNNTSADTPEAKVAIALQNYLMNFEVTLVNQDEYDYSASKTVSERCFWKFLKETGAIRWVRSRGEDNQYIYTNGSNIYEEESEYDAGGSPTGYQKVVVGVGQISAGNSLSNEFGMYNETYVNIPSTYGRSKVFFKINEDNNYRLGEVYINREEDYLAGRSDNTSTDGFTTIMRPAYDIVNISETYNTVDEIYAKESESDLPWYEKFDDSNARKSYAYFTETEPEDPNSLNYTMNVFRTGKGETGEMYTKAERRFLRSRLDGVEAITDIDEITNIWDFKDANHSYISYDTINTDNSFIDSSDFNFNAILVYYSIYDKNNAAELACNLFGLLFLNGPSVDALANTGDSVSFNIPVFNKRKSNGAGSDRTFGTGYSFKINVKSTSIYDNTDALINDETTTNSLYTEDFNNVIYNLNKSVDLINKNTQLNQVIYDDYKNLINKYNDLLYSIQSLNNKINDFANSRFNDIDASNINTEDLQVNRSLEIKGSLYIDPSVDMNIENLLVTNIDSNKIDTEILDSSVISTNSISVNDMSIKFLDTSSFLSDSANMYTVNIYDDVFQEVNVGSYNMLSSEEINNIHKIVNNTKVSSSLINGESHQYVIHPVTFNPNASDYEMGPVQYLYNGDEAQISKVNYTKYVPILIVEMQNMNKKLDDLKRLVDAKL